MSEHDGQAAHHTEDDAAFAQRIRECYPEGLTGIFAIGATRRTYILEKQRLVSDDPGRIDSFPDMGAFLLDRYFAFCGDFFALGGQNMIIGALSYRSFFERGPEYAQRVIPEVLRLIGDEAIAYYQKLDVDPYFIGLEVLLRQPENSATHVMAGQFRQFMQSWPYQEGRRRIVWEIASIPLLTFWDILTRMTAAEREAMEAELQANPDFPSVQATLHKHFSHAVYGTPLPLPQLYVGTNMSGDLKFRAPLPLALSGGEYLRAYYTPYPTLFMTRENLKLILEDLAFADRLHAPKSVDYSGKYTRELADAEYLRITGLAADPSSILGMKGEPQDES